MTWYPGAAQAPGYHVDQRNGGSLNARNFRL